MYNSMTWRGQRQQIIDGVWNCPKFEVQIIVGKFYFEDRVKTTKVIQDKVSERTKN